MYAVYATIVTVVVAKSKVIVIVTSGTKVLPSATDIEFDRDLPDHKALGLKWNVSADSFSFGIDVKDAPSTRREILSLASSLYDPLGLIAPVTLVPKLILQDLCRKEIGWDDEIPNEKKLQIRKWTEALPSLQNFQVDRCVKPHNLNSESVCELHHFADASSIAYGVASYLRIYDKSGMSKCTLIAGKSRLAPIKSITIPRLELSAAMVAARLHQSICREMNMTFDKVYFWTDSQAVLHYINNKTTRYKTFVANRLAAIHEVSEVKQWNYVPSSMNPADLASRGIFADDTAKLDKWIRGPEFLQKPDLPFPEQPTIYSTPKMDERTHPLAPDSQSLESLD